VNSPPREPVALGFLTVVVVAGLVLALVIGHAGPVNSGRHHHRGSLTVAMAPKTPSGRLPRPLAVRHAPVPAGYRLLTEAALACRMESFRGVETLNWRDESGSHSSLLNVWQAPGGPTLAWTASNSPRPAPAARMVRLEPAGGAGNVVGDGMLGLSQRLVSLLGSRYRLYESGTSWVAGRPARMVTARRPNGRLAARFWLDEKTGLPLRREVFSASGRVITDATLATVSFGAAGAAPRGTRAKPWGDYLSPAAQRKLRARGWQLPRQLPGRLALLRAREDVTRAGTVVDLDYTDGLSVVSIFVQRGHLPAHLPGWSSVSLGGALVYADDSPGDSVTWSARGFVYTVVAVASQQTLAQVVTALPHDSSPHLLTRIGHGLDRVLSWIKP